MSVKLGNNVESKLTAFVDAYNTVFAVENGGIFPILAAGEWFPLTVEDEFGYMEIVHVTGRAGNALTVIRGMEGTAPRAWGGDTPVSLRMTAAVIAELTAQIAQKMSKQQADTKYLSSTGGTVSGDITRTGTQSGFYKLSLPNGEGVMAAGWPLSPRWEANHPKSLIWQEGD